MLYAIKKRHIAIPLVASLKKPTMLDFYLIKDDQSKPNDPEKSGLELIGRLDDRDFEKLQYKEIIDRRFDYYSSFRWDTSLIKKIQGNLKYKNLGLDDSERKFTELIEKASLKQSGLIAYGD